MTKALSVFAAALVCFCGTNGCGPKPTEVGDLNITEVTFPDGKKVAAETMLRACLSIPIETAVNPG